DRIRAAPLVLLVYLEACMPLYEYACQQCGHRFEVRQHIRDQPLTTCPSCGGPIRRVVQPVGIVFKGSGFYKNDSRSESRNSAPAGERKETATTPAAAPASGSDGSSSSSTSSTASN